mmetsp:Transcript_9072/g.15330  ORF Transcript_9072/g.15330 Transcript_9072/m.15330 type:complete len:592 (-) Transcript_9072:92-1867(-)
MKSYMRPKSRVPRTKRCDSCGKQVLLAGFDCHAQKCSQMINPHNHNSPTRDGHKSPMDSAKAKNECMKDFNQLVSKHSRGTYSLSTRNAHMMDTIVSKINNRATCKYCLQKLPQNCLIQHMTSCSKNARSKDPHNSPVKDPIRTGRFQHGQEVTAIKRQTPYELSKGRTQEFLKANTFIQEISQERLPETVVDSRPSSRPSSGTCTRRGSGSSLFQHKESLSSTNLNTQTVETNDNEHVHDNNATQIELLERKIQEIENKLSPKTEFQHVIKSKLMMPFNGLKSPQKAKKRKDKGSSRNLTRSTMSTNRMNGKGYSSYPDIPSSQLAPPPPIECQQCEHCNRTFRLEAFQKHKEICLRVFVGKRPFYDSSRSRLRGTPMEFYYWKSRRSGSGQGSRRPKSAPKTRRSDGTNNEHSSHSGESFNNSARVNGSGCGGISNGGGTSARNLLSKSSNLTDHSSNPSKPPPHQYPHIQQLQQLRSSTAPTGASRRERGRFYGRAPSSSHSTTYSVNNSDRTRPKRKMKYYSRKKNYGLFSLRLNLYEVAEPAPAPSGGCRVVKDSNWRKQSRNFREAITAARVLFYSRQCTNKYKC